MRRPRLNRSLTIAALLGGMTIFSACLETKNPVTAAKSGGQDKALCGAWQHRDKDGTLWIVQFGFLKGAFQSPWMCFTFSSTSGTNLDTGSTACFVSRVGGVNYLNVANDLNMSPEELAADAKLLDKIHEYEVLKYELKDGKLLITFADNKFVEQVVKQGRIAGKEGHVTASSEALASFLNQEHSNVFPAKDTTVFTKI